MGQIALNRFPGVLTYGNRARLVALASHGYERLAKIQLIDVQGSEARLVAGPRSKTAHP